MQDKENTEFSGDGDGRDAALIFHKLRACVRNISSDGNQRKPAGAFGTDLCDGSGGLAFYFAAYYRATRDPEARSLALTVLGWVRAEIHSLTASLPIGGLVGLGSLIYVLAQSAEWLDEQELLHAARVITEMITPALIRSDQSFDVMNGCAGTLLALLSFGRQCEAFGIDPRPSRELAVVCGEHLLESRVPGNGGYRAWPTADKVSLPGFVHGAGGISYALFTLYRQTGDEQFRDAAFEGFALERTLYDPALRAPMDPHSAETMNLGQSCEGAVGIALARLGCVRFADIPALRFDLEEALSIVRSLPDQEGDQICCGNFGRIDVLYTAGDVLGRLHLVDYARESSRRIVARSAAGGFSFTPPLHEDLGMKRTDFDGSLFFGLAGIGYVLLRLNNPGIFPPVLLLDVQH